MSDLSLRIIVERDYSNSPKTASYDRSFSLFSQRATVPGSSQYIKTYIIGYALMQKYDRIDAPYHDDYRGLKDALEAGTVDYWLKPENDIDPEPNQEYRSVRMIVRRNHGNDLYQGYPFAGIHHFQSSEEIVGMAEVKRNISVPTNKQLSPIKSWLNNTAYEAYFDIDFSP